MLRNWRIPILTRVVFLLVTGTVLYGCRQKEEKLSPQPEARNEKSEADRILHTKADLVTLSNAMSRYEMDTGSYPADEEGLEALIQAPPSLKRPTQWKGPYIDTKELPKDGWGNHFIYRNPGQKNPKEFDLFSSGHNGIPNDRDDVWKP